MFNRYRSFGMIFRFCAVIVLFQGGVSPRPISAFENEAISAGQIFLQNSAGKVQALHLKSEAQFSLSGFVAHVELRQEFRNQTDQWQEAIYVLPLSETAAVNEMEMHIGDRVIKAVVKEKLEARKTYQQAKSEGKKAALVEQSRPNVFQQTVANIAPYETIVVKLSYVQTVDYDAGEFSFRFPMTMTPRFMPGSPVPAGGDRVGEQVLSPNTKGWALPSTQVPDANLISPPMVAQDQSLINPITLTVYLDPGLELQEIGSQYHNISVKKIGDRFVITTVEEVVPMDRDFVLSWRPVVGNEPKAAVFRETIDGEDYLMLMMLPPAEHAEVQTLPRDMMFVIDTSGSMQGTSIDQAKASLKRALGGLRAQDRFNIIEFNTSWTRLFGAMQHPDPYYLDMAEYWVDRLSAGGGTHMLPALSMAIGGADSETQLKHIIFITDGAVGNETALFELIHRQLGDARLFPVGIGSAPNSFFMRQAAKFGRGIFTHIGGLNEVGKKMDLLYQKIDRPIATDLQIQWPGEVESYPARLPALYQGQPLIVVAKAPHLQGQVHITGVTARMPWTQSLSLETKSSQPGVGTLWARRKIEALEDERIAGRDAEAVSRDIVRVALKHRLVSRHTSLVAVEEFIARLPSDEVKTSAIPNLVAQGQVAMFPNTATNATFTLVLGLVAALIATLILLSPILPLPRPRA